jgi:hypothetical protein
VQHSSSGGITRKCGYLCEDRVARHLPAPCFRATNLTCSARRMLRPLA